MKKNISSFPGIYIHFPFCERKCGYCDFYSVTHISKIETFVSALLDEISLTKQDKEFDEPFDTIYFGGGTPSLLKIPALEKILSSLYDIFPFKQDTEITIEVNPGTVSEEKLKAYKEIGVNRLSIGVQSFDENELHFLERIHSAGQAREAIEEGRKAGFDNIGLDLISALPSQSIADWENNLRNALSYRPEHLSIYNLTYEQGTPFYKRMLKREITPKAEKDELRFMERTIGILKKSDYLPYEVSNYAQGEQWFSRHNYKYWNHSNYLGFGPSAHSFWDNVRTANARSLQDYFFMIESGRLPVASKEKIDKNTLEFEHIFLSLRTYAGLNLNTFKRKFGFGFINSYKTITSELIKEELAEGTNETFRLTQKGMFICDEILPQFIKD